MDWITVQRRVAFAASLVVLAGGASVVYQFTASHFFAKPLDLGKLLGFVIGSSGSRGSGPQSPVRIVGGSIKLKENGNGWTSALKKAQCAAEFSSFGHTIQSCIASNSLDAVDFSGLMLTGVSLWQGPPPSTTPASTSWLGLDQTWTITAFARGSNNMRGVDICVSDGTNCGAAATAPHQIAIAAFDNTNMGISLEAEHVENQSDETTFRYRDPNSDPSGADTTKPKTLLEHMGQIVVTVGGTPNSYDCTDGACQIYIGN
jgi:hypothetical protein